MFIRSLIMWLWAVTAVHAQTYTLRVRVLYGENPVSGARVEIERLHRIRHTDSEGWALFRLPAGIYTVKARKGDLTAKAQVHLQRDTLLILNLQRTEQLEEVVITAVRADENTPVTRNELKRKSIEKKLDVKDIPYVLDELPSVVAYSDPGHGVGYTGLRIRGIGARQINVTLNGIPLNDPESQAVYWVDIPDFVSTVGRIQLQRGIGTSTYGTGSFGANIHMFTQTPPDTASASLAFAGGSFNTKRLSLKAATGKLHNRLAFLGRVSSVSSDGYIDRAFARMKSYFLSSLYKAGHHRLQFLHFGGHERTYQAWYGVDKETFETNPRFNYAGAIYDENGRITGFYDNEVDDYTQQHYQLHHAWTPSGDFKLRSALFYVRGYGYYEQFKQNQNPEKYGIELAGMPSANITSVDLVRRKWLDNHFYGIVLTANLRGERHTLLGGTGWSRYDGLHFGEVIWARFAGNTMPRHRYYENKGTKTEVNAFIRDRYDLNDHWYLHTDMQIRHIDYRADYNPQRTYDPSEKIRFDDRLFFVNPKIGIFYRVNSRTSAYVSAGKTHREPNRTDYKENAVKPKPETLYDLEAGLRLRRRNWRAESVVYYMYYLNQLVYTGRVDEVGNPVRENVGRSYRTGWENNMAFMHGPFEAKIFFTLSRNRNIDYVAREGDTIRHYGNTTIAYSPEFVGGVKGLWKIFPGAETDVIVKHVGKQYMDNRNIPQSVLPAYTVVNAGFRYEKTRGKFADKITFFMRVYNILNVRYAANGYMWGDTPYYFPQAGRHYAAGVSLEF